MMNTATTGTQTTWTPQAALMSQIIDQGREDQIKARWTRALDGAVRADRIFDPPGATEIATSGVGDDDAGWKAYLSLRGHVQSALRDACDVGDMACYNSFADSLTNQVQGLLDMAGASPEQRATANQLARVLDQEPDTSISDRVKSFFSSDMDAAFDVPIERVMSFQTVSAATDAIAAANAAAGGAGSGSKSRPATDALDAITGAADGASGSGADSKGGLHRELKDAQRKCKAAQLASNLVYINPLTAVWNAATGYDSDADIAFQCGRVTSLQRQINAQDAAAPQADNPTPKTSGGGGKRNGGGGNSGGGWWDTLTGTYSPSVAPEGTAQPPPRTCKPTVSDLFWGMLGVRGSCDTNPTQTTGPIPGGLGGTSRGPTGIAGLVDSWFRDARRTALAMLIGLVGLGVFWVYFTNKTAQIVVPALAPVIPSVVQAFTSRPVSAVTGAISNVAQAFAPQASTALVPRGYYGGGR